MNPCLVNLNVHHLATVIADRPGRLPLAFSGASRHGKTSHVSLGQTQSTHVCHCFIPFVLSPANLTTLLLLPQLHPKPRLEGPATEHGNGRHRERVAERPDSGGVHAADVNKAILAEQIPERLDGVRGAKLHRVREFLLVVRDRDHRRLFLEVALLAEVLAVGAEGKVNGNEHASGLEDRLDALEEGPKPA